jgi:hypothetical protein
LYTEFLKRTQPDDRILVIYDRPVQIVAAGYGGVDFDYARNNAAQITSELKNGLFREVLVLQHANLHDGQVATSEVLPANMKLEKLFANQITESLQIRISRVTGE